MSKKFNIEILSFYPKEKSNKWFTALVNVLLTDFGIELSGCFCKVNNGKFFISVPRNAYYSEEEFTKKTYPVFKFSDESINRQFVEDLKKIIQTFVEERLADTENPMVFEKIIKKDKKS